MRNSRRRTWLRRALLAAAAAGILAVLTLGVAVEILTAPRRQAASAPPDERVEAVRIATADGIAIAGWFLPAADKRSAVLLLHGLGATRATMFARASFLAARGHAVLAIDHRAHGESGGTRISFGHDEARDVTAALDWLRAAGHARVAIIGFSLGGAAALLAEPPIRVDAIVLEAVYADIREAVHARIAARAGRLLADLCAPLLVQAAALRLAIPASRLDVLAAAGRIHAPALLIAGERDRRAPVEAMQRLRAALPAARELLVITGADHQDFFAFDREAYAARVGEFLAATLD